MNTKLTIIVDNTSTGLFKGEWGLSILVEYNDKKILVDAGASDLFLKNMQGLGIEVKDIDYVCTGHCTEKHAYEILKEELGDRLEKMMVGLKKEF